MSPKLVLRVIDRYDHIAITVGLLGLLICYVIDRTKLRHISFDISDLSLNQPSYKLFRLSLTVLATGLLQMTRDHWVTVTHRVPQGRSLANLAAVLQLLSAVGVLLVAHWSPKQSKPFHFGGAGLGFGCAWLSQCVYSYILREQEVDLNYRRVRLCILTPTCAIVTGVGKAMRHTCWDYPVGALAEWTMLFSLMTWYWCFRIHFGESGADAGYARLQDPELNLPLIQTEDPKIKLPFFET